MFVCLRELSDIDKDGRLTLDEFLIALHLLEKAKKGIPVPRTLPPELSQTKRTGLEPLASDSFNFEDKRKENFEQGRMELERRRKLLEEQATKERVSMKGKREKERERGGERERERERGGEKERDRERKRQGEREKERDRERKRKGERETERRKETGRKRGRQSENKREVCNTLFAV